jgi:hypothetical protein
MRFFRGDSRCNRVSDSYSHWYIPWGVKGFGWMHGLLGIWCVFLIDGDEAYPLPICGAREFSSSRWRPGTPMVIAFLSPACIAVLCSDVVFTRFYDLEGLGIRPQHCKKRLAVCQSSPFAYLPPPIKSLRNETSGFFRYRGRFLGQCLRGQCLRGQ